MFIITSIQQELRQFRKSLPLNQATNGKKHQIHLYHPLALALINHRCLAMILLHYHVTELSLYEASLCKSPVSTDPLPKFKRLELLCACLEAIKSYFEVLFSIPVANYASLSIPTFSHLTCSLSTLYILSNFDHPDWNLTYVRETINYVLVLGRLIEHLERLNTLPGFEKLDMFARIAKGLNYVKGYVEGKMAGPTQAAVGHVPDQMLDFAGTPGTEDLTDFFQFMDDAWMTDILESSDYQANAMAGG